MSKIQTGDMNQYYEQIGEGSPLVFVHGAFADARVWEPQWNFFSSKYSLLRYDLRGHGRTGDSSQEHYSMTTFVNDLSFLLDALGIDKPIICGLSWGGSIAQAYAVENPQRIKALILAGSAVAIDLTLTDKVLCNMLVPWWFMSMMIKIMNVKNFVRFSMGLARLTMGKNMTGRDKVVGEYLEQSMNQVTNSEYLKIWQAIYGYHLLPLEKISCPTLILNGEFEPKNTFRHTKELLRHIPHAKAELIPNAHHGMNMEEPGAFNEIVDEFLQALPSQDE